MLWWGPNQYYEASTLRPSHHLVAYPSQFESSLSSSILRSDNAQQSRRQMVAVEAQRSLRCLKCVDLLRAQHLKDDNRVTVWVPLPTARRCILHGARDCNVFTPLGAVTSSDHSLEVFLLDSQEYSFVCDYPMRNGRLMPLCTRVHGDTSSTVVLRTVVRIGKMQGIGFHSVRMRSRWTSFVKFQILFVINY
jgi:hypothetical protein